MPRIRIAIAGVGNCASALVQGIDYYGKGREHDGGRAGGDGEVDPAGPQARSGIRAGLMQDAIGCYRPSDLEIVAAFDVDARKVGRPVEQAIFAAPNCTRVFAPGATTKGIRVDPGPVLDGVADHMRDHPEDVSFRVSDAEPVDVTRRLRDSRADILVCYLPVGSERAVRHYAEACLEAGVALVNCVPVFLASDPDWAGRFRDAGLPLVGDDVKSQLGATIVHRTLARLFADRGVVLDRTYQLNTGGNTDFLNMLERDRLASKRRSKTESVQSQLDEPLASRDIHVGPSDYVAWQGDNKVAFIRLEGRGFGDVPLELELRLSVQDSPNSAGVVIDAIRCARVALDRGEAGPLEFVSAYYMKRPPRQMRDDEARRGLASFLSA